MITDFNQTTPATLDGFDVAVIGAGFAGIECASRLARSGVKVLVLESGTDGIEDKYQDLFVLDATARPLTGAREFNPHIENELSETGRVRALGGTSRVWSGRWKRLDAEDFEARPWVPLSGWPISARDLEPYYQDVERDYGLPDFNDIFAGKPRLKRQPDALSTTLLFEERKWPTQVQCKYARQIKSDPNILVVTDATILEIETDETSGAVTGLSLRSARTDRTALVKARRYVLAAGGLETPRILLASNSKAAAGVGNANDQVGRYYMEHPKIRVGTLTLAEEKLPQLFSPASRGRRFFATGLALSKPEQQRAETLNHNLYLSGVVKDYKQFNGLKRLSAKLGGALKGYRVFQTTFYLEQAPNPDSRVILSSRRDALGVPGINVGWNFTELDRRSLKQFAARFADIVEAAGIGQFDYKAEQLDLMLTSKANHPMGTSRMAASPKDGVVDSDCRVFTSKNLFIAGSSVFSTAGNANPTYTIVCLARRLADHIQRDLHK